MSSEHPRNSPTFWRSRKKHSFPKIRLTWRRSNPRSFIGSDCRHDLSGRDLRHDTETPKMALVWHLQHVLILLMMFSLLFQDNHELMLCAFMSCHLIGMSSACFNPMLYGYCFETERSMLNRLLGKCAIHVPCLSNPENEENDNYIEFQTRSRNIGGVD